MRCLHVINFTFSHPSMGLILSPITKRYVRSAQPRTGVLSLFRFYLGTLSREGFVFQHYLFFFFFFCVLS